KKSIPEKESRAPRTRGMKELFTGGILLVKNNYLLGVFILSTFYEIINLVIETGMLRQARDFYGKDYFIIFKSYVSLFIQIATILLATIIPRFFKRFGIKVALLILPLFSIIALSIYIYDM